MMKRVPVYRKHITLPLELKSYILLRDIQEREKHDNVIGAVRHYEMHVRQLKNLTGYHVVPLANPEKHRNWKIFEYLISLCDLKGWGYQSYIDAQFERLNGKMVYPNALCSDNAIKFYIKKFGTIQQLYRWDEQQISQKERGKETLTIDEEVHKGILRSIQIISYYMNRNPNINDEKQYKAIKIYQSWSELSPYYLWSVPFFHDILPEIPGSRASDVRQQFNLIQKSSKLQDIIRSLVERLEREHNIPPNIIFN